MNADENCPFDSQRSNTRVEARTRTGTDRSSGGSEFVSDRESNETYLLSHLQSRTTIHDAMIPIRGPERSFVVVAFVSICLIAFVVTAPVGYVAATETGTVEGIVMDED